MNRLIWMFALLPSLAFAQLHTFKNGEVADAKKINENFQTLEQIFLLQGISEIKMDGVTVGTSAACRSDRCSGFTPELFYFSLRYDPESTQWTGDLSNATAYFPSDDCSGDPWWYKAFLNLEVEHFSLELAYSGIVNQLGVGGLWRYLDLKTPAQSIVLTHVLQNGTCTPVPPSTTELYSASGAIRWQLNDPEVTGFPLIDTNPSHISARQL